MQITAALLTILASISFVAADKPVQYENGIRTPMFKNPRLGNPLEVAKKRYLSIQKRSGTMEKRDPFQAALYNDQGSQYLINVGIGTPNQTFAVTLDTGSADLWVPSTQCPATNCPFSRFDVVKSSTFKTLSKPFGIQYGIGSVNGTYATDTVTVGGAQVQDQQFGLASITSDILNPSTGGGIGTNSTSGTPSSVEANGILGMGYPSLTQANSQGEGSYNPFVFNLAAKGLIKEPIFSIYLNSINQNGYSGEIIFGGVDTTKFDGNLTYLPVASLTSKPTTGLGAIATNTNYYYWMVYGQGLGVMNSNNQNPTYKLREVGAYILDTGTTLTYLPTSVATDIVTSFAGSQGYALDRQSGVFIVDCATSKSPAQFYLQMSQSSKGSSNPVVLAVPASELVIPVDSPSIETAKVCMFGIAPLGGSGGIGANMYLVGDSVLRSAYMVFDMGQNRVGLAASKGIGGSVSVNGTGSTSTNNGTSGGPATSSSPDSTSTQSRGIVVSSYNSLLFTIGALSITALTMIAL